MAELYWPEGDALGGTFGAAGPDGMSDPVQVVGIVDDVHWRALDDEPTNFAFLPMVQYAESVRPLAVAVRTAGDPESLLPLLREAAEGLEPDISFQVLSAMDTEIGQVVMPQRVGSVFLSGFGVLALVLATVGIFGLISYTVREQRRAIAVRMALGASRRRVIGEVAREVVLPAGAGLTLGLAASLVFDDALATFLYGVSPGDVASYAAAGSALALAVLFSTLLPARQAARVDAMQVLRSE
jgi:predicted lysophospholipase L1 biosynthesis ABC-type transport system permease subunit